MEISSLESGCWHGNRAVQLFRLLQQQNSGKITFSKMLPQQSALEFPMCSQNLQWRLVRGPLKNIIEYLHAFIHLNHLTGFCGSKKMHMRQQCKCMGAWIWLLVNFHSTWQQAWAYVRLSGSIICALCCLESSPHWKLLFQAYPHSLLYMHAYFNQLLALFFFSFMSMCMACYSTSPT